MADKIPQRIFKEFNIRACINKTRKGFYTVTSPQSTYRRFESYEEALRHVKVMFVREISTQLAVDPLRK